jgi:hypothetical protein
MATTTTNFGWDIPQSTDLVKDGATAIAALGQDIDTALVDLKGGTTGQVLAKATNADLDFSWVAQDDSNAIQNSIVDAKGDLISATANDTPARLAVGTNGHVLTADSTAATGIKWAAPAAGGGLTLITTATPSGAAGVDFTSLDSSYKEFYIEWNGIHCSDATTFDFRFNADSGSNYDAKAFQALGSSVSAVEKGGTSAYGTPGIIGTHIAGNNIVNTSRGSFYLYNANGTSFKTYESMSHYYDGSSGHRVIKSVGIYYTTAAITQINIARIAGSGTISTLTNGGIRIWGVK